MRRCAVLVRCAAALGVCPGANHAAPANPGLVSLRSSSGQFLVVGPVRRLAPRGETTEGTNSALSELGPSTLVVSCERIKQAFHGALGLPDIWYGTIAVVINPGMTNDQPAVITAKPFADGWQYRLEVPPRLAAAKLVRGVVQVLLLELANRQAGLRSADIPLWLSEGLSLHVLRSTLIELVLAEPRRIVSPFEVNLLNRTAVRRDPLAEARDRLQTHTAMSFTHLGELTADQVPEETWKTFQATAQLLVSELLRLPGGPAALVNMLMQLPSHFNWQTAFLNTFQAQFPRLLDVEKWWSVVLVHFTGQDPAQAWSPDVAMDKLDDVLHPPVLVSLDRSDLPHRRKMTLQEIVQGWDYLRQRLVLQGVASQLLTIRIKLPPEIVFFADQYRTALGNYVARRDRFGAARSLPGIQPLAADRGTHDLLRQLDDLDRQRLALRPLPAAPTRAGQASR